MSSGKTMLAAALASILPDLDVGEALEVASIYSVRGPLRAVRLKHDAAVVGQLATQPTLALFVTDSMVGRDRRQRYVHYQFGHGCELPVA